MINAFINIISMIWNEEFSHEFGHALGMQHDFCNDEECKKSNVRNYPRKDDEGNKCWGETIMDYNQVRKK